MSNLKDTFKIITVGLLQPLVGSGKVHLQDYIYYEKGIAPTLTARDWKSPRMILVIEDEEDKK